MSSLVQVTGPHRSVAVARPFRFNHAVKAAPFLVPSQVTMESRAGEINGGWLSILVMLCTQLLEFMHSSTAVQVRLMTKFAGQDPGLVWSVKLTIGEAVQLSLESAEPWDAGDGSSVQVIVVLGGQVTTGLEVS